MQGSSSMSFSLPQLNAFDGGPVQPRTIGLDQSVQMTKQLVWDLDGLV